ncbi:hypothetical protein [Rhodopirellula islandica]|nr:hypothetical protein [Rhodopirellula islandica]
MIIVLIHCNAEPLGVEHSLRALVNGAKRRQIPGLASQAGTNACLDVPRDEGYGNDWHGPCIGDENKLGSSQPEARRQRTATCFSVNDSAVVNEVAHFEVKDLRPRALPVPPLTK